MTEPMSPSESAPRRSGLWKAIGIVVLLAGLVALSRVYDVQGLFRSALEWTNGKGVVGYAVFVAIYVVACVAFVPGSILTLGAGAVFGFWKGFVLVSVASTLGATAAFLVGRYIARDWVAAKVAGNAKFKSIDDAVAREGWKIVGLTRLSPAFPFNLLNYAYGLTRVPLSHYFLASWIGMMPGTMVVVYAGSLVKNVATLDPASATQTTGMLVIRVVGFVVAVLVTVMVTRMAQRALAQEVAAQEVAETAADAPSA